MKRIFRAGGLALAAVSLWALGAAIAAAQQTPQTLDIAGVRLGMTVDQARAALQQFDPTMKIVPLYGSWDDGYIGQHAKIENFPGRGGNFTTVTALVGVSIQHAYDENGNNIDGNASGKISDVTGNWFLLEFAPGKGGGLYAVIRRVRYADAEVKNQATPAPDAVLQQFAQKYGKPSKLDRQSVDEAWLYDLRGRLLTPRSREFGRCAVFPDLRETVSQIHGDGVMGSFDYEHSDYTASDFAAALTETDGATLDKQTQSRLSGLFNNLYEYLPNLARPPYGVAPQQYRQCGTELTVNWIPNDNGHLSRFTTMLANLDKTFFDNGLAAYFKPGPSGAPDAAPKL